MMANVCVLWSVLMMSVSWGGFGGGESKTTVTIQPDGSGVVVTESTLPRRSVEQQIQLMAQWQEYQEKQGMVEQEDEDEADASTPKPPVPPKPDDKPLPDAELVSKAKETYGRQYEHLAEYAEIKTEVNVELAGDDVRVITTSRFATLSDLLTHGHTAWATLGFDQTRLEPEAEGKLRWTFQTSKGMLRYRKNMAQQWKATGFKTEVRFVLPGKILSSPFPNTEGRETGLALDAKQPETLDALTKLYETNVVIVAEAGGLALKEALDSKQLQRRVWRPRRGDPGADLPVADAGPGFLAEAVAVTLTTTHHFPEGKKYLGATGEFDFQRDGAAIQTKLFAPKGRTIRSVSELRVLEATDDKGRAIQPAGAGEDVEGHSTMYQEMSGQPQDSTQLQLQLQLPERDAETIEQVEAEAVVTTVGQWKETAFADLRADKEAKLDLAPILPGATLTVTKLTRQAQQSAISLRVEGPAAVGHLDFQVKVPGSQHSSSHVSQQNLSTKDGQTVRTLTITYWAFDARGGAASEALTLLVRHPEEIRRERVKFTLSAIDLF